MRSEVSAILADANRWARTRSDIRGLALVGSHASGKARADSDVDLVIVTDAPISYQKVNWVPCAVGQRAVVATCGQPFGNVWSLFVTLAQGPEIEFTFAERAWVRTDPPAPEVCRIVRNGLVILYDPLDELLALCNACGVPRRGQTLRV